MKTVKTQPYAIPLENVESEHCAMIVNKGLQTVTEISQLKVALNNKQAIIETDKPEIAIPNAVKTIRDLGYDVATTTQTIPVLQMTCASCAVSVESIINFLPGVVNASVNYASAAVKVEYIPSLVTLNQMREAVQSIGYDLFINQNTTQQETLEDIHLKKQKQLKTKTLGAIVLSIPLVAIGMFFMDIPYANYIMWLLATPIVLFYGKDFYVNAWKQLKHRSANMDTLVALSTGVAYVFSVFNTLFPDYWHAKG